MLGPSLCKQVGVKPPFAVMEKNTHLGLMMQMCQSNINIRVPQYPHLLCEVIWASQLVSFSPSVPLLFFPPCFNRNCTFLSCFFWRLWHSDESLVNQFRSLTRQQANPPKIVNDVLPVQWAELSQKGQTNARTGTREESRLGQEAGLPLLRVMSSLVPHCEPAN